MSANTLTTNYLVTLSIIKIIIVVYFAWISRSENKDFDIAIFIAIILYISNQLLVIARVLEWLK